MTTRWSCLISRSLTQHRTRQLRRCRRSTMTCTVSSQKSSTTTGPKRNGSPSGGGSKINCVDGRTQSLPRGGLLLTGIQKRMDEIRIRKNHKQPNLGGPRRSRRREGSVVVYMNDVMNNGGGRRAADKEPLISSNDSRVRPSHTTHARETTSRFGEDSLPPPPYRSLTNHDGIYAP